MRPTPILLVGCMALAACSNDNEPSGSSAADTTPSVSPAEPEDSKLATVATTTMADGAPPSERVEEAAVIELEPNELPEVITDTLLEHGGDIVDPGEWDSRYGGVGMPNVAGGDAQLVEATGSVALNDGSFVRTDERNWLVADDRGRDAVLADLAAELQLSGPERTETQDNGAQCVVEVYPAPAGSEQWQLQGCEYPSEFGGVLAIGVSRTNLPVEDADVLDSTVVAILEVLGGTTTHSAVSLTSPRPDGSTLDVSTHIDLGSEIDVDASVDKLLSGPLKGWSRLRGDKSAVLTGPSGMTWTIGTKSAVMNWVGRW